MTLKEKTNEELLKEFLNKIFDLFTEYIDFQNKVNETIILQLNRHIEAQERVRRNAQYESKQKLTLATSKLLESFFEEIKRKEEKID